jgi:hypothetical protein
MYRQATNMPDMVQQHSHGRATCIEVILNLQCAETTKTLKKYWF